MISGLLLLPFCGKFPVYLRSVARNWKIVLGVSFLQTSFVYALFYTGMTMVPGAIAAIVIGSGPLISAVAAHYMMPDDELSVGKTLSLFLGLLGIILIAVTRQPWSSGGLLEFSGILILLISSISSNLGNIFVARDGQKINPLILNSAQIFLGGLTLLLISLPIEGAPRLRQPLEFYLALIWLALLSAVAFSIWFTLLKKPDVKVSELNLWKFIIPVFGAILSWMILPDESPELFAVIGMLFVAGSILAFHLCGIKRKCG